MSTEPHQRIHYSDCVTYVSVQMWRIDIFHDLRNHDIANNYPTKKFSNYLNSLYSLFASWNFFVAELWVHEMF